MRVNVSMIHEARMIAKHVYKFVQRYEGNKKPNLRVVPDRLPLMMCVSCLRQKMNTPAVTVYQGNAMCMTHLVTY